MNLGMEDELEEQLGEEEARWEMKSLSSVDEAILAKQNQASVLTGSNDGFITKIGTDGNIHQVARKIHAKKIYDCLNRSKLIKT